MALGISPSEIANKAQFLDELSGKTLAKITDGEINLFNVGLQALASQLSGAEPLRAMLEKYQYETLSLARSVMYMASSPFGGPNAQGTDITFRLIRPVDVAYATEERWDQDLSGTTPGTTIWGFQTGSGTPAVDTMGREEGNIIFGFIDPVPTRALEAYQVIHNGNRTFPYYSLNWNAYRADGLAFSEAVVPIIEWPEDTILIQMTVAWAINPDRTQAVGLHIARARSLVTAIGSA